MDDKNGKFSIVVSPEKQEKSEEKTSFWHINKQMLPYKVHFFFFIGGMGATLPFFTAFGIIQLGLTASNIAAVFTAQQALFLVFKPSIGYLADYLNRLKAVIVGLTIIQAVFSLLLVQIPSSDMPGIKAIKSSKVSQNEHHECHFCIQREDFEPKLLEHQLDEDSFRQVVSCINDTESERFLIYCSDSDSNSSMTHEESISIMQSTCSLFDASNLFPIIHAPAVSNHAVDVFLINVLSNSSQISAVCFIPKENFAYQEKLSLDTLQYCRALSNSKSVTIQQLFLASHFKTVNCSNLTDSASLVKPKGELDTALNAANFKTYQFWLFAVTMVITCTCASCIFTISDTACYESVPAELYGRQRAWGAVSWGLTAPLAGFLNDYTDNYVAAWGLMAIFCSVQIWNLRKMDLVKPDFSQNMLKDIKKIFGSLEFVAFEIGVFLNGVFTGIIWYYLTWFIAVIGGNKLIIGLAHTVQCYAGEVPIMFVSGWLIKKFGHFNLVSLALIAHGIRFFIYSYLHNPWWILPIESLHGFTFGSFYSAMTSYGKLNCKPGTEATTQSVLCTTYEALGAGLGCMISGICFDYYGAHTTFFYASFLCALSTFINVCSTIYISYRKGNLIVTETTENGVKRY